jgi:hypothetical protein
MKEINGDRVTQRDLYDTINDFRKEVGERFDTLEKRVITRSEFEPVQRFVNGAVTVGVLVLVAILGLLLSHVIPGFHL